MGNIITNVLHMLYRDCMVSNVMVHLSDRNVSFMDGTGIEHTVQLNKGARNRAYFTYKGAKYYLKGVNLSGGFTVLAYRLCTDTLICCDGITVRLDDVVSMNDFNACYNQFLEYK